MTLSLNTAHFPHLGPVENPLLEHYALEVAYLSADLKSLKGLGAADTPNYRSIEAVYRAIASVARRRAWMDAKNNPPATEPPRSTGIVMPSGQSE